MAISNKVRELCKRRFLQHAEELWESHQKKFFSALEDEERRKIKIKFSVLFSAVTILFLSDFQRTLTHYPYLYRRNSRNINTFR